MTNALEDRTITTAERYATWFPLMGASLLVMLLIDRLWLMRH